MEFSSCLSSQQTLKSLNESKPYPIQWLNVKVSQTYTHIFTITMLIQIVQSKFDGKIKRMKWLNSDPKKQYLCWVSYYLSEN